MKTFARYIKDEFEIDYPAGDVNGSWFAENGLPMIVECCCCGMSMASPNAMIDHDGKCYCSGCAE